MAASLLPLLILLIVVGGAAFIGYQMYLWSNDVADKGRASMEKRNMSFTKDGGLRVGVKDVKREEESAGTQSVLVNMWNHASFPNYKSRLGWGNAPTPGFEAQRPTAGRTNSGRSGKKAE